MGVLDEILVTKRDEVTVLRRPDTRDLLRRTALAAPPTRGFAKALQADPATLAVIAEIKRRSPSKGDLAPDLDPGATARAYAAGNASGLSVLTDGPYFGGSMADLQSARDHSALPALRKDFVIDEVQIYESRAVGADAILLIVAALPDDALLRDLHELALGLGLDVLVEVHDEAELDRALTLGALVVGVNSRSLQTFGEDLGVAEKMRRAIPADSVAVAESAIRSVDDAQRMADAGFDAVLVGEALVRADDPTALCAAMAACRRSTST
jgi:indole-3-glycerol phosphate synthase